MDTNEHFYSIGQFASYGRVSVRMLRHYDAIGLLLPDRVDPSSGYRWYRAGQFATLARIVALREQGFGLEQIATILDGATPAGVVRGLFVARAAELRAALEGDRRRLESVEDVVRRLEGTSVMSAITNKDDVTISSVDPVRVYVARSSAEGYGPQFIGPVVGPLFQRLQGDLVAAGLSAEVPAYAWYVALDDEGGRVEVNAAFPAGAEAAPGPVAGADGRFEVFELPAIETAAVLAHHGPPDTIGDTWMQLGDWISREGYAPVGPGREVYLSPDGVPMEEWVTEVQIPVAKA